MDKLEQYLDQVCHSIGGPPAMRQHVRQELREHLLDAVAQHKDAGLSDTEALDRALEEFGKAEEVKSELEAAHGLRMMWIIDKAMQWKETTMKAKWLWTTWAYLSLAAVFALEALFLTFIVMMILPKFEKLLHDGIIDQGILQDQETAWMVNTLFNLFYVGRNHTPLLIGVAAVVWGLFEWLVRSENKAFMRISALGTAAFVLTGVVIFMTGSLLVLFCLGMPAMTSIARPWAEERVGEMGTAFKRLEEAQAKKDWPEMQKQAKQTANAAQALTFGPAITSLTKNEPGKKDVLQQHVHGIQRCLAEVQKAIQEHDEARLEKELHEFRKLFAPVREAAKRPAP